jgi:ankyrin repeat protein
MGLNYDEDTLIRSAARNDLQAVRLLLAAGMPTNTSAGGEALRNAAAGLHLGMVQLLFESGARDDRALREAVASPDKRDVFNFLLAHQPSSAALGSALRAVAGTSYTDLLQMLLDRGVDVNSKAIRESSLPYTALHAAARAWRLDHVVLLLARGADVNVATSEGETATHAAIADRSGDEAANEQELIRILEVLVEKGANVNARWRNLSDWQPTPLMQAIRQRRSITSLWLLEHGADANVWTGDSGIELNPLMLAARSGLPDVVRMLLARGVQVDQRNKNGETALIVAFYGGRADRGCTQALLGAGADVNARDNEGQTALIWAARRIVDVELIRLLLAAGASVNARDKDGRTALMYAAQADYFDAVIVLLGAHADASLKSKDGLNALMIATEARNQRIVRLLSERGPVANATSRQAR